MSGKIRFKQIEGGGVIEELKKLAKDLLELTDGEITFANPTGLETKPQSEVREYLDIDNVDNTSDVNKPISIATQSALNLKTNQDDFNSHVNNESNPHNVTASQVGLGNVDNTSDVNKPISIATQSALDNKLNEPSGNGIAVSNGANGASVSRTITASNPIQVSNGNGVSGNPSITIQSANESRLGAARAADQSQTDLNDSTKSLFVTPSNLRISRQSNGAFIAGDLSGNPRGSNAIDIQSGRLTVERVALGIRSSAFGQENTASGYQSSAVGYNNTASGYNSSAVGYNNTASGFYFPSAFGQENTVSGYRSCAFGSANTANGNYCSAFGYDNTANFYKASAFGADNTAAGYSACAFGRSNSSSSSYTSTFGYNNIAESENALAVGNRTRARTLNSVVIGNRLDTHTTGIASVNVGILNNTTGGTLNLSNGFISSGTSALTTQGRLTTALGIENSTIGERALAVGFRNETNGGYTSAIGYQNTASGNYGSSAFGYQNTASGNYVSSAFGAQNTASGNSGASAFGYNNTASGDYSFAFGGNNTAISVFSSAFGYRALSNIPFEIAFASHNPFTLNSNRPQKSIFNLNVITEDDTEANMFTGGHNTRIITPNNCVISFFANILGIEESSGDMNSYWIKGHFKHIGGNASLSPNIIIDKIEEESAWSVNVEANNSNKALEFKVTGESGKTIKWSGIIDCTKTMLA